MSRLLFAWGGMLAVMACGDNAPAIVDAPLGSELLGSEPLGPAMLTASPASVDFGSASPTTEAVASVTVTNAGQTASGPLMTSVTGSGAASFSIVGTSCTALAPGASCTLSLKFAPTTVGVKNAELNLTASPGGLLMIPLGGTALSGPGGLVVTPSSHSFGAQPTGTTSAASTFTIFHSGAVSTGALTVTPAGTNPTDFAIASDTCTGAMLAGASSCTFSVQFTPTLAGGRSASFLVTASPGGTANAPVSGIGQ